MTVNHDFARYAALAQQAIAPTLSFTPETETDDTLQVERGTLFPLALQTRPLADDPRSDRLINLPRGSRPEQFTIVDHHGHRRPFYRGLLVYAWTRALQLAREELLKDQLKRWERALRTWADTLEQSALSVTWGSPLPASLGHHMTEACWSALALHAAGQALDHSPWRAAANTAFIGLAQGQQSNGAFLLTSNSDNPETFWYHELVILHAAASFAADTRNPAVMAAVQRNAEFHLNETQPDHATTQPLAVFAFAATPNARPLADQILHAVRIQHPAGVQGLASILLADAIYCLTQT